ncbi:MAG: peptide chain release factor 2 [Rickettsiaceae bacterium]|nr:peptide chain release factor 2 [Rickettsiaceae bacterium]
MSAEFDNHKELLKGTISLLRRSLDPDLLRESIATLTEQTNSEDLWQDQARAQKILREKSILSEKLERFEQIENKFREILEFAEMLELEPDKSLSDQLDQDISDLYKEAKKYEIECLFAGEADGCNAFLEINAGAGGTESHDWASIMMRMYLRFAERLRFKTEIINILDGEEAGIKSAIIKIKGHNAYGWFKTEAGVHRLVRISPFNAAGKRMTSFASCWVYPEIDDNIQINIEEKDLRIDTYRASGAGGQHVNTTDSAVRITHIPTNTVVQCQNDRSQHKNKAEAMKMLKSKLYEIEMQKKEEAANVQNSSKTEIGWGHQIRSYVLQPYQMVKDLRTNHETSNVSEVLDGDLEKFVYTSLAAKVSNTRSG